MRYVTDKSFNAYGRVLDLDVQDFVEAIMQNPAVEAGQVVYEPSVEAFEKLKVTEQLTNEVFGEMPVEFGHCSGFNTVLNALEYHRSSEIDIAATDLLLMVGRQQDIDYTVNSYDTAKVECFMVPKGTVVELYATTLHYAPCSVDGKEFRCGVLLPKGTNLPLTKAFKKTGENSLLFARNKWLLAHAERGLEAEGACVGLKGKNIRLA